MIRPVQYACALDGKLIAVEQGPHKGWAIGNDVYATENEANLAAGRLNQEVYIEEQLEEVSYGLSSLVYRSGPFAEWREKYDDQERERDLVADVIRYLFPSFGTRSEDAERFAEAFIRANEAYIELHGK